MEGSEGAASCPRKVRKQGDRTNQLDVTKGVKGETTNPSQIPAGDPSDGNAVSSVSHPKENNEEESNEEIVSLHAPSTDGCQDTKALGSEAIEPEKDTTTSATTNCGEAPPRLSPTENNDPAPDQTIGTLNIQHDICSRELSCLD